MGESLQVDDHELRSLEDLNLLESRDVVFALGTVPEVLTSQSLFLAETP